MLYQNEFRTPEYFWFSPDNLEWAGFRLMGQKYEEIPLNDAGWRWSESLNLYLGVLEGKLRYFNPQGVLVPTPEEAAIIAQLRAEQLAAQLRALGVEPEV